MRLKEITDRDLIQTVEKYVREERELLTTLLHHFREIERRRLFCDYGYGSLHKMLVGHFGYSDDEAYRRTSALRLLNDLPEVEQKINQGELSLSHLSLARTFFQQESKATSQTFSKEKKLEFIEKIQGQSLRQAQRTVLQQSTVPKEMRPDKMAPMTESKVEFRFLADSKTEAMVTELRGLLAHQHPDLSLGELFEKLCDLGLEQWRPKTKTAASRKASVKPEPACGTKVESTCGTNDGSAGRPKAESRGATKAEIHRQVWRRDGFQCRQCGSQRALEIDHQFPRAKGGTDTINNLRVLCRACNQRAAIRHFGSGKMDPYLNSQVKP